MQLRRFFRSFVVACSLVLIGSVAEARSHKKPSTVSWTTTNVREGSDQAQVEVWLKEILKEESKKARWGKKIEAPLEGAITLTDLRVDEHEGVVRVSCSAIGKIPGVGAARSKFSYGGRPEEKLKLKRHVIELVARGIIGRLSEMVREKNGEAAEDPHGAPGSHGPHHGSTAKKTPAKPGGRVTPGPGATAQPKPAPVTKKP